MLLSTHHDVFGVYDMIEISIVFDTILRMANKVTASKLGLTRAKLKGGGLTNHRQTCV